MAPIYLEIVDYILDKIHTGEWPVDYMIPTEMQLCEQFGVSRPTVRAAVLRLVQEGYLRRVKGKGTYVTSPRVLEQSTVFIESFLREMSRRGMEVSTEVLEFRWTPADDEIKARLQTECEDVIKLSRLRYVKDSFGEGPIVLTSTWFPGEDTFLFRYDFEHDSLSTVLGLNGKHRRYIEKELTAIPLTVRDSRLLGMEEGSLAMRITSTSWDEEGNVVEISESLYPLSRNQFILKLQL